MMTSDQTEMLGVKNAIERIVGGLIASHSRVGNNRSGVIEQQINEFLHAFVASSQLKDFRYTPHTNADTFEVWVETHNKQQFTLTFKTMLPLFNSTSANVADNTNQTGYVADPSSVYISADTLRDVAASKSENTSSGVSWPFPVGQASAQAPVNRTKSSPKINFIRNREDLQKAGKEENPEDTYDRVKKAFY